MVARRPIRHFSPVKRTTGPWGLRRRVTQDRPKYVITTSQAAVFVLCRTMNGAMAHNATQTFLAVYPTFAALFASISTVFCDTEMPPVMKICKILAYSGVFGLKLLREVQGSNPDMRFARGKEKRMLPQANSCVVVALSKNSARTSFVYALQLVNDKCIKGQPFPLHQRNGKESIWPNRTINREEITFGSILRCQAIGDIFTYLSNTAKRMVGSIHYDVSRPGSDAELFMSRT